MYVLQITWMGELAVVQREMGEMPPQVPERGVYYHAVERRYLWAFGK